jgi:hypothetical protein
LYLPISARISVEGISPASDSGLPLTSTMTLIACSLGSRFTYYLHVERATAKLTTPL